MRWAPGDAVSVLDKVGWPVVSRRHVGDELSGRACGELRVLAVVHKREKGKGAEVAKLTAISREQATRSGKSWCGGDDEGDLRRWRFGRGQCGGFGARERSGLG